MPLHDVNSNHALLTSQLNGLNFFVASFNSKFIRPMGNFNCKMACCLSLLTSGFVMKASDSQQKYSRVFLELYVDHKPDKLIW